MMRNLHTILLVSTAILGVFITDCTAVCPDQWNEYNGKCYYFSVGLVAPLPWHESEAQCEKMGGTLVVIDDATEDNFVQNRVGDAINTWIGLHNLNQDDQWEWVDGTPLSYTNWIPGQPDYWQEAPGGTEDCVSLNSYNQQLWNDMGCVIPAEYICERPNDAATIDKCDTANGWQELYNGKCYKFVDNSVAWTIANDACKAFNAELVAITSEGEQKALSVEINSRNKNYWIGLSSVNHASSGFYWSNEVDSFTSSSYNNWDDGEPASSTASTCVEVVPSAEKFSPWKTQRCGEEHGYICETGLTGSCADGWRLSQGSCYLYVLNQNAWGSWIDARDHCSQMGGNMLVIETEEEQQYISQQLPEFLDVSANEIWLGISDTATDGVWVWEDENKTPVDQGYTNWNKNQPLNRPDTWDCVQIYTGFYLGRWETGDCFMQQPYICELPPGVEPKPLVPVANTHKGCNPGWLWFDDNCYYFGYDALTWEEAESTCRGYGGHLSSVLSGDENSFLVGHVNGDTYIGGHAVTNVNNFQWSDNSPWGFENWADGEPNNKEQGCVHMWSAVNYQWDDVGCKSLKNYVCKNQKQDCWEPLGMEDRTILDSQITADSMYDEKHAAYMGRLNNDKDGAGIGAWASGHLVAGETWFQVQLTPARTVSGITTQGRPRDYTQWVINYKVAYSNDMINWVFIKDSSNQEMIFVGNKDMNTKVTNKLPSPIVTSYIRIYPMSWNLHAVLRAEILGCTKDGNDLPTPSPDTECTSVSYEHRLDCGYPGVDVQECRAKGCCWDSSVPDTTWCFYKKDDYDTRCGKDWTYDPAGQIYCYHFNPYKIRDRNDAQLYCYNMGGTLLSINSMQEQYFVTAHVTGLAQASALWIGANRLDDSEGWKWSDGNPFNYRYWRGGEPNDWTGEEYCVEMYTSDATWNDNPCNYQRGIACKKGVSDIDISVEDGKITENICEGDSGTLVCGGNRIILIHHASYGRGNIYTCGEGNAVPQGGCHSTDSFDIVSQQCNGKSTCTLVASNEIYGDPCHGTYKYLNIIYSCETATCVEPLGMENGTITSDMITESSSLDSSHKGNNGRLNGATSWATNLGKGEYMQIVLGKHMKMAGILLQGANDADRWVQTFKIKFAKDETNSNWIDYKNGDGNVEIFTGSSDRNTITQIIFAERLYSTGIRIYPQTWNGDLMGMRVEILGCNPFQEITCATLGDEVFTSVDKAGATHNLDCPAFCPEFLGFQYEVYGTGIYSGNSQICTAAIHAGVLIDELGGTVTIRQELAQSAYEGSERHEIKSEDLDRYTPISFSFSNPEKNCETGWIPYEEFCYLPVVDQVPWQSAEAACVLMDSHIVSIPSPVDQDFVWQTITLTNGSTSMWLGLNNLVSANEYTWSDDSLVFYTSWGPKQPDVSGKSCVFMDGDTGKWDDDMCETPRAFMCKKFKGYYKHDDNTIPTAPPGCQDGWVPYEDKCYWFQRDAVTYIDSKDFCSQYGAVPITILDKYTQSFLHTIIGVEDYRWWLGLSGEPSVGGSSWKWESGYDLDYDNWARGNPDITNGECAVFFGGQFGSGLWYSYRCENPAYSICELERDGYTPRPYTTQPPSGGCPGGWVTPNEGSGWCYRAYLSTDDGPHDVVSWNNAYHQCLNTGGDLISIHDSQEDQYILQLLTTKIGKESDGLWMGLNNKATASEAIESGWQWSDDSAVSYVSWSPGYPSNPREQNCVELRYEGDLGTGKWRNIDCDQQRDFICKLKKGIEVLEPTIPPTGVYNPQCGSSDDGVWLEYEGWCYLFNGLDTESWHSAEDICTNVGGHLASIHLHNEQSFITNQMKMMNGTRYWLGLYEQGYVDGEFQWVDGSVVDFVNWMAGEPNDRDGTEQCVTIVKPEGRWNDANCGIEYGGYICKKRIGDTPAPPQPTDPWPGGCPSGWLMYDNYCYQVHGEYTVCATDADDWSDGECRASWADARTKCKALGADLVTIHNKYENAFVAAQILRLPIDAWIGMTDETWWNKYHWANGDEVTYTNWYSNEPNHLNGEERCVEMYHREDIVGRWNDNRCENPVSYVCSMPKDSSLSTGSEINNNKKCPKGWMQYDTVNGNYICYYLETTAKTFDDAQNNCNKKKSGANLASMQTMYEQAFVTSYIRDATAWIGLQIDTDGDEDAQSWKWIDDWPVWITNWGAEEPVNDPVRKCVMSVDSALGSEWVTADCTKEHMSVCRWTTESVPPTPGQIEGTCPPGELWQEFGGFCYREFPAMGDEARMFTWSEAEEKCTEIFGHLVSIGSRSQTEWIKEWSNTTESLWIGLRDNGQGGWSWTDNRPVVYTNWAPAEPNNWGENGEDCGEVMPDGKWNDNDCGKKQGFMCRVPKAIATDENGNIIFYSTKAPKPINNSNAGVIVGAILGSIVAIILIAGVGYYLYKNDKFKFKTSSSTPDGGFENPQYSASGSKGFDDITTDA